MSFPMLPLLLITGKLNVIVYTSIVNSMLSLLYISDLYSGVVSMVSSHYWQEASLNVSTENFPPTEDLLFVLPKRNLQYVIVPEMRFNCYSDVVTSSAIEIQTHQCKLQWQLDCCTQFVHWLAQPTWFHID